MSDNPVSVQSSEEDDDAVILLPASKSIASATAKRNSTIVSVIIHALLLLIGLSVVVFRSTPKKDVAFIPPDPQRPRLEPQKRQIQVQVNRLTKKSSRPKLQPRMMVNAPSDLALPEIKKNPDATPKQVQRNFNTMGKAGFGDGNSGGYGTGIGGDGGWGLPAPVFDRCTAASRSKRIRKSGGRMSSEKAVQKALAWFQAQQNPDGSFGDKYKVAMTGLALLAYLGHCETPESELYGRSVQKMIDYLVSMVGKGKGGLCADVSDHGASYSHGIAIYALGEAYIMTGDPEIREPFIAGIQKIISGQNADGGWTYDMNGGNENSDTSVSGWQIQALKAAYLSGLADIDEDVKAALDKSAENMKRVYSAKDGHFGYRTAGKSHGNNLTGAGALTLKMWKNARSKEAQGGINAIIKRIEEDGKGWSDNRGKLAWDKISLYSLYYDTQAVFTQGGRDWKKYNNWFQSVVVDKQNSDGSWPTNNSGKHHKGGVSDKDFDVYRTALYTLSLEVYYRYLPVVDM